MSRTSKIIGALLVLSVISNVSLAQHLKFEIIREKNGIFSQKFAEVTPSTDYSFDNSAPFTSLSIQIDENQGFEGSYFLVAKDTFLLSRDEHVEAKNGLINANLLSFDLPITQIQFYSNQIDSKVIFNFINGSIAQLRKGQVGKRIQSNCLIEPVSTDQQIWRIDLQAPQYDRSFSKVKHLIIHHSAGSNTNENYTQVVRDIYIYHTEVNGWSDIGYNYLIAQDGTIFKGRDPDTGAQDDVRGAHFCGMNTGTMGVCLLGDYTSIAPKDEAIESLLNLLSWKLDKEDLNAFESFSFNSIPNLGAISGHRDGCATECPGTKTYLQIANFKRRANSIIEECYPDELIANFTWSNESIVAGETVSFTDASLGVPLVWDWKMDGAAIETYAQQNPNNVEYPNEGEFNVSLIIRNGSRTDTASIDNLIIVAANPFAEPSVFPNPVSYNNPLIINLDKEEISEVEVVDVKGKIVIRFTPRYNQMELDYTSLNAGIYIFRFLSEGIMASSKKIIIMK